jgi:hypothetical protein
MIGKEHWRARESGIRRPFRRLLWPILRAMEDAGDFDCVFRHLIHHDVGQRRKDTLAASRHSAARTPETGKRF